VEPALREDLGGGDQQVLAGLLAAAIGGEGLERHGVDLPLSIVNTERYD
jgi:hypothetical protein